jgi:hypothetical protein
MSRNSSLRSFSTPNNVSHDYTPLHENLTRVQVAMERKVILICEGAVDYLQVLSARQESFFFRLRTVQLLGFEAYVYLLYKF